MKIYRITIDQAYQAKETGTHYSLEPWGPNTAVYHGSDDGGEEYDLPEGYSIGLDGAGSLNVYDSRGMAVDLAGVKYPALVTPNGLRRLRRTVKAEVK